jgi:quinol monooxygenase YgiN
MPYVVTYIDVQPDLTGQAIDLIRQYQTASAAEDGCLWGETMQERSRRNRFVVIEAWKDESVAQIHEGREHTNRFRSELGKIHNSPNDQRVHHEFSVVPVSGKAGSGALNVVTHVDVPPPRRDETEVLLKRLAEESRKEEGNLRYDIFQQLAPRTNHFTVFAVWSDQRAYASHELKSHTRQFREALGPMLGAPYDERLFETF